MDWTIVQGGLCERGACSEWASGLSLAAEQSIGWSQKAWIWAFVQGGLCWGMFIVGKWAFPCADQRIAVAIGWSQKTSNGRLYKVDFVGACSKWASGLSLVAKQSIGRSLEAWIGRLYKVDFVKEGHVQSGQVGFPLLLNKALKWGQETWIWAFYKWHSFEEGMFRVGKWAFPCC